jgi:hypothetical protein
MKKNTKINIIGISFFFIISLGMFSTITMANGNYNIALTKGTEIFTVSHYDEAAWETVVNASTTPSSWFEGESNYTGARSKYTIKGWNYVTWESYDVFVSFFLPALFESKELIPLLGLLNSQGFNETTINANYTNSYNLWYGLRALWNFTIGSFKEDPTYANDPLLIFQNPTDIDDILNDYNNLSAKLNNNFVIQMSGFTFPILESDEFLWLFIFNGLALGTPTDLYLEELITTLNCQNATVNNNILIINRVGETNYTIEITYGSEGTTVLFTVKDISDNIIYQIVSRNSEWIFYTIIIILALCIGGLSIYLIFRKSKINRLRKKK